MFFNTNAITTTIRCYSVVMITMVQTADICRPLHIYNKSTNQTNLRRQDLFYYTICFIILLYHNIVCNYNTYNPIPKLQNWTLGTTRVTQKNYQRRCHMIRYYYSLKLNYLHARFTQVDSACEFLSHVRVRVVRALKHALERAQLRASEGSSVSSLFFSSLPLTLRDVLAASIHTCNRSTQSHLE